jgi:prepilin-type processing-associated H-X9-DG protein
VGRKEVPGVPGRTNYLSNYGTKWDTNKVTDGPFHIGSGTTFAAIRDGTSNTAAFSEHALTEHGEEPRHPKRLSYLYVPVFNGRQQSELEEWCHSRGPPGPPDPRIIPFRSGEWTGRYGDYRHIFGPNHHACNAHKDLDDTIYDHVRSAHVLYLSDPTSFHPGGVNMLFCDGSVRFISDTIARKPFQAIGTRDGKKPVGDF